jgi:uncharacterized protein (TIGR02246 family)
MIHRFVLVAVFVASFVPTNAAAQAGRDAAAKAIEANERAILTAIQKQDVKGFISATAQDGVVISPGGVMTIADFVKSISQVKLDSFTLDQVKVTFLTDTSALISYRFTGTGTYMGQALPQEYATSAYVNRGGKWISVFHQETVIVPPPAKK